MAGLAGGALSLSQVALGYEVSAGSPPLPATPIARAVQSVMERADEHVWQTSGLKLSATLHMPAPDLAARDFISPVDDGLPLRRASALAENLKSENTLIERPLILSQMLVGQPVGVSPPRWMSLPDSQMQLRSSREISSPMPGAAGLGRSERANNPSFGAGQEITDEVQIVGESPGVGAAARLPVAGAQDSRSGESIPQTGGSSGVLGWEIPPIRWGGSLGYSLQASKSNSGQSSTAQGVFGSLTAASYVYAPWFARVSGRLGLSTNSASSTSNTGLDTSNDSSRSSNVVGGGEVNMFSSTRFPFRAYFDRTDSTSSGFATTASYVANRFGLNQNFRAEDGLSGGGVTLDRSSISASDGRKDDVTAMSGTYSLQSGVVQNNFNGRYSQSERSDRGEGSRLIGLNSTHIANLSDTLSLGAIANFSDSEIRSSGFGASRGRYAQLYGYGTWLPEFEDLDDLPLTLSGGVRYSGQDTQFGGDAFQAHSLGANLSAMYRFTTNLSVSANGAINSLMQAKGQSQIISTLGTGVTYVGVPLSFGKFSYNWNTGANANWQSPVATTPANMSLNGQVGHTLSRVMLFDSGQSLALNASQTFNSVSSGNIGTSQTLSNSISANLGVAAGERFTGTLSTSLSDVRSTGYIEQAYRILNVGLYGQGQLSQVSSINMNMAFSWSDQSYQAVDAFGQPITQNSQRMALNGSAAYTNSRFVGVRGLRYNAIFTADTRLRDERLFGNVNGDLDRSRFMLTNRLDYRIGLLDFRFSLVNNEVGGKKNALLFFQVSRQIGSY